jgi:Dolichyl-phosphate-mannose-protein mannosyltransferase
MPFTWSRISLAISGAFISFWVVYSPPTNAIAWDVFGYYYYLPATFYHSANDPKNIDWVEAVNKEYKSSSTLYQFYKLENGNWICKYSSGLAMLYSPFFLTGHIAAKVGGWQADGYSAPYQQAMIFGCLLYSLIGLALLRKILLKYVDEVVAAVALLLIALGTNYFHNAAFQSSMPHNPLFTLYALIIWCTIRWHESQRWPHIIMLGLACGLAIASRPTEMLALLIPALWGVYSVGTVKEKISLLWNHKVMISTFGAVVFACGFPQMMYWHSLTGEWLYFSYGNNAGEGFEFKHPFILQVLFSFRKGWLVYTPLMIFAIAGFYFLVKKTKESVLPIVIFFALNLYVVSSWSCWYYADSFSQRALVQSYPLIAIPFALFIAWAISLTPVFRIFLLTVFIFLAGLNQFQTWQLNHGILDTSRMTAAYYWAIFGKTTPDPALDHLLLVNRRFDGPEIFNANDPNRKYDEKIIGVQHFDTKDASIEKLFNDSISFKGGGAARLTREMEFTPAIRLPYNQITTKDHAWMRVKLKVYPVAPVESTPFSIVMSFKHKDVNYKYNAMSVAPGALKLNEWNSLYFDYLTPEVRRPEDVFEAYVWLQGGDVLYVDEVEVVAFEPFD